MISFIKNSVFYTLGAGILKLSQFLVFMFLASQLTVEDYATFGFLLALMQGIQSLAQGGLIEIGTGVAAKQTSLGNLFQMATHVQCWRENEK